MAVLFVAVVVYEAYCLFVDGHYDNTISQWVNQTSKNWRVFTFLCGFCCGHLFFPLAKGAVKRFSKK